jgi:hypothetical protein
MMNGIRGLIVALGLGIAGALFNFVYLNTKTQEMATVDFVGVKPNKTVERGEPITADHLTVVSIPKSNVGNLMNFAVLQSAQATVVGRTAPRTIAGGSLLLVEDTKTPPSELAFDQTAGPNEKSRERGMCIPINTQSFVPSLINPGDEVSLLLPRIVAGGRPPIVPVPTPAAPAGTAPAAATPEEPPPTAFTGTEVVGPFKVLSVGNRLGSLEVMRAGKISPQHENVLTISVTVDAQGNLEAKAQRLWDLLRASNTQGVGVLMHPRARK